MNVSDLLNPVPSATTTPTHKLHRIRCISTPVSTTPSSPVPTTSRSASYPPIAHHANTDNSMIGKPRSRFSEYEDNIIRQGVAQRLTWGQISDLLPHRKRATCFNRYRTLQGIRKSRKLSSVNNNNTSGLHSPIPLTTTSSTTSSEASSPDMTSSPTSPVQSCFNGPKTPPNHTYTQLPIATAATSPSSTSPSHFQWFNSTADIIYEKEQPKHHHAQLPTTAPPNAPAPNTTATRSSSALYPRHFHHDNMTSNRNHLSSLESASSDEEDNLAVLKRRRLPSLHYPPQPQTQLQYHPRHSVHDMRAPQPFYRV